MWKNITTVLLMSMVILFAGCQKSSEQEEADKGHETDATVPEEIESESDEQETDAAEETDDSTDEFGSPEEIEFYIEQYTLPTQPIDNLYNDDKNLPAHTEVEIVDEYMGDDGVIYFALDEQPVRNITSPDGKINNITNYSDQFINITEEVAYILPEEEMMDYYHSIISIPADMLGEAEDDDADEEPTFRTFEEMTNLEKGIISSIGLTGPLLNELGAIIEHEAYDHELYKHIIKQFEELGSPAILIPAAQTPLDLQLFNNMLMIKELWADLGSFEDPQQDVDELINVYELLRQETNNLLLRINYALSGKYD